MGKIANLAKQATNEASAEEQFDLLDYLGNLAPIQYLGNKIDDAAKYFGLEHGLSGTLARYAENLINNKQPATSDVNEKTMPKVNFMQNPDEQLNTPKPDATTAQYEAIRQDLINGGMSFEEADKLAVDIMFPNKRIIFSSDAKNPDENDNTVLYKAIMQELIDAGISYEEAAEFAIEAVHNQRVSL